MFRFDGNWEDDQSVARIEKYSALERGIDKMIKVRELHKMLCGKLRVSYADALTKLDMTPHPTFSHLGHTIGIGAPKPAADLPRSVMLRAS